MNPYEPDYCDEEEREDEVEVPDAADKELEKLVERLSIEPQLLKASLSTLVQQISRSLHNEMLTLLKANLREEMRKEVGAFILRNAEPMMMRELEAVLSEKIVIAGRHSWDTKEIDIKSIVHGEFKKVIDKFNDSNGRGSLVREMVNKVLSEDMAERISEAVEEVKKDTVEHIKQDAMKEIVKQTAQIVAADPKLVMLMAPSKSK